MIRISLDVQPTRRGCLVVDVWSDRADLWASNNLVTLCARLDSRIEVCKHSPGPILRMQLTALNLTNDELPQKWEEIRVEASGGARSTE